MGARIGGQRGSSGIALETALSPTNCRLGVTGGRQILRQNRRSATGSRTGRHRTGAGRRTQSTLPQHVVICVREDRETQYVVTGLLKLRIGGAAVRDRDGARRGDLYRLVLAR